MDVTRNNFSQVFPDVIDAVDKCDFVSIDVEFTGLCNGPRVTVYDTPSMYYDQIRARCLDFLVVQVGLCAFRFDPQKNKHVYKAFNFYVFPRAIGWCGNDGAFLCQSSSVDFLCKNGFDFNKLFKEGITCLSVSDAKRLLKELNAKYENVSQAETVFSDVGIPDEFVETVESVCSRIEKFLSPDNEEKEITFENCRPFLRKWIHQTVQERFPSQNFCLFTRWVDSHAVLVAQKGKMKADMASENYEREKKEILDAAKFSELIRRISEKKKLVVGHNMMLDICHIVNRFCWPLPDSYLEFKGLMQTFLPRIIDTKYMCNAYPFKHLIKSSAVSHMLKRLRDPPFELTDAEAESPEFAYSMGSEKAHEAGYDAYVTGLAFISLTSYLGKKSGPTSNPPSVELLKPFENRVNMMRLMDYEFFNFQAPEPIPSRRHVFHITFPEGWKTVDIVQLFKPYGDVHVAYIDHISAWVTLLEPENAKAVIANLARVNLKESPLFRKPPYKVITLRWYYEKMKRDAKEAANVSEMANASDKENASVKENNMSDRENTPVSVSEQASSIIQTTPHVSCEAAFTPPVSRPAGFHSSPLVSQSATRHVSRPAGFHSSPLESQFSGDEDPAVLEVELPSPFLSRPSGFHSSPLVSQSSGDADPVDLEVKLSKKRSMATVGVPRKRKKHTNLSSKCRNRTEDVPRKRNKDNPNSKSTNETKDELKMDTSAAYEKKNEPSTS